MVNNNTEYELYELVLKDEEDEVFALSLVNEPAIMQDFVYFNLDGAKELIKFATADEDQHTIVGPILIPELKILRLREDGTPYYVTFSKDTVKKIAQKYIRDNYANNVTLEHAEKTNGVSLVESWVAESSKYDKSKAYGLNVKPGTWMGVFKVENKDIWNKVKSGEYKGISLEGLFSHELIKASLVDDILEKEITELSELEAEMVLSRMRALIKKDKRYKGKERIEFESYSDYGSGVRGNSKRALEWAEKNGWGSCGTPVGKQRANQLAKGEPISVDTIKRMYSYLSRHEVDLETSKGFGDGCGYLMYQAWGGKAALGWSRNKLRELGLLTETEAQPSITSSYPGEAAKKKKRYTSPALLAEECPEATYNIELNLANRQKCIDEANYGPLNPNEPNEEYWKRKGEQFKGNIEEAKKARCGNCSFFYRTPEILECIAEGLGNEVDPEKAIDAGDLGYCEAFDFKCASERTCDAWVVGGPITK